MLERYSLLRLHPNLSPQRSRLNSPMTLYKLLDSAVDGAVGKKVSAIDGSLRRVYSVEKYERFKAGLMARVWLKRVDTEEEEGRVQLIRDEDAIGLKWQIN